MYTVLQEAEKEREKEDDGKYKVLQEVVKEKEDDGLHTSWEKAAKKEIKMKQAEKENENWRVQEKWRLFECTFF